MSIVSGALTAGPSAAAVGTPVTFSLGINQSCFTGGDALSYPPPAAGASGCGPGASATSGGVTYDLRVSRTLVGSTYIVSNVIAEWDTSSLPDDAYIERAYIDWGVVDVESADSRSLSADYYDSDGGAICLGACFGMSDYSPDAQIGAVTAQPLDTFAAGNSGRIELENADANIDRAGNTGVRLHITGSAPSGHNYLQLVSDQSPTLTVEYLPDAPATPHIGVVDEPVEVADVPIDESALDLEPNDVPPSLASNAPDDGAESAAAVTRNCLSFKITGNAGELGGTYDTSTKIFHFWYRPNDWIAAMDGVGYFDPYVTVNHHRVNGPTGKTRGWWYFHHHGFGNPLALDGVRYRSDRTLKAGDKVRVSFNKSGFADESFMNIIGAVSCRIY